MPVIETKVKASSAAASASGLVLWALGRYVFKGGVPDVVTSWTYAIVPGVITFAAGYLARHTFAAGYPARHAAGYPRRVPSAACLRCPSRPAWISAR